MVKALFFILGSVVLFSTVQAKQICFESQPPQINFSCETRGVDVFMQVEVLDVTNAAISKKDFYMGIGQYGAYGICSTQKDRLYTALKHKPLQDSKLIALCEDIENPKLLRIVLRSLPPYITVLDQKAIPRNISCGLEMDAINNQP